MTLLPQEQVFIEVCNRLRGISYIGAHNVKQGAEEGVLFVGADGAGVTVEPVANDESWQELPKRRGGTFVLRVIGCISTEGGLGRQIVNEQETIPPGIYRFEEDIKKAIEGSDLRYSGNINNYKLRTTSYRNHKNNIREVVIEFAFDIKFFTAENRL